MEENGGAGEHLWWECGNCTDVRGTKNMNVKKKEYICWRINGKKNTSKWFPSETAITGISYQYCSNQNLMTVYLMRKVLFQ